MISNRKINDFVNIFKKSEKERDKFKIGIELEHYILNEDLSAISYQENNGIKDILHNLTNKGWDPVYKNNKLFEINKNNNTVTLEPGGQLELSIKPVKKISTMNNIYLSFLTDIMPILNKNNQFLVTLGYQPITPINKIKLLPRKRYFYMHKYLTQKGKMASHMMKGTASIQVNIDYENEEDYKKKYIISTFLVPIIYTFFDNSPFFQSDLIEGGSLRAKIWNNTDSHRCGLYNNFSYKKYARFLLNTPPIIIKNKKGIHYTGDTDLKKLYDLNSNFFHEHILTMVFPEIRTKNYIEIRSCDSLPYPQNLGYVAFIKNIFYNKQNLNTIYEIARKNNFSSIKSMYKQVIENNIPSEVSKKGEMIYKIIKNNIAEEDKKYLKYIDIYFDKILNPRSIIQKKYRNTNKISDSISQSIIRRNN